MKKRFTLSIVGVALLGLMAAFATTAQATPTKSTICSSCHTLDAAVVVSATRVATSTTTATYDVSVSSPFGRQAWAAFRGSTRYAGSAASTGTVTVPRGVTYRILGVGGTSVGSDLGDNSYNSVSAYTPAILRTVKIRIKKSSHSLKTLTAKLKNKATGVTRKGTLSRKSGYIWAKFTKVQVGANRLTVTGPRFTFKPRTVTVR